nr:PDZ domain-containing protein [Armatimonas sp.]
MFSLSLPPALVYALPQQAASLPAAPVTVPESWVKALKWRSLGPPTMGGRIVGMTVYEADPNLYWIATASGGLLKTTNNGTTFEHQFDKESSVSIGAVAVAQSDPKVVWVGTGENNPRNSVSYGDGVYKSLDGGKTWQNMGLKGSYQVGDIVIDPRDPNTVYVGALGRLYGESEERGLYKTTDGGKSWARVLYFDNKTGVIDIAVKPGDPNTMLVALWERKRDEFDAWSVLKPPDGTDGYDPEVKWGKHAGIYKTTDGGKSWKKLTNGLPTSKLGRVGLDFYAKNPNTVFAIVDCEKIGQGAQPKYGSLGIIGQDEEPRVAGAIKVSQVVKGGAAEKAGLKNGDVIKALKSVPIAYRQLIAKIRDANPGEVVTLTVLRDGKTQELSVTLDEAKPDEAPDLGALIGAFVRDGEKGVSVAFLRDEGAADKAGIAQDDLITEAAGKPVTTTAALLVAFSAVKPGEKVALTVLREGKEKKITVERPKIELPKRPYEFNYLGQAANVMNKQGEKAYEYGGVYRSDDCGETWTRINSLNPRPMYFSQIRVDPTNDQNLYVLGVEMHQSRDGGKTFTDDAGTQLHPDQHALWINPRDSRHMLLGCDGGTYVTYDRCANWEHLAHVAIGQAYHVSFSPKEPFWVFAGFQDNGSWGGPTNTLMGSGASNDDWLSISGGDGFVTRVDQDEPDWVYTESQGGSISRTNLRTGERGSISPRREKDKKFGFNWNTPFVLSAHNQKLFYTAGNYVFKSLNKGNDLRISSPKLGRSDRGTATALAESPQNRDVLWVGTDDGMLWVSRDGGLNWKEVSKKLGISGWRCLATIEASRFVEGRAYVALDGHRSNDDKPYLFVTEDFGETWRSVNANLPSFGSTRCLREDTAVPDLLYCGTELAAFVSIDRGASWTKLNANLPTVAVHELAVHPATGEVVAATHGRSLWVLDANPFREMAKGVSQSAYLYPTKTFTRWRSLPGKGSMYGSGVKKFVAENPPRGAQLVYSLTQKATRVTLNITDIAGKVVFTVSPKTLEPGLYRVEWNGGNAPTGAYRVSLEVDGKTWSQTLRVENDPLR